MVDELIGYDAIALGELIRKGEISPVELLETTIQRIEKVNPNLNAVIHKMYDSARETAETWNSKIKAGEASKAIFSGVPFLLKDLIAEYKGAPFHEGSHAVKGYISKVDSELVRRQKAGGLIIVGKTNTPEFGCLPSMEYSCYGPTHTPWNPELTPGCSSGGSAAAVAAGIVPMAHGNDAGGSIRIPASCCGLFGLKPTRARNPLGPLFGDLGGGIVHEHAITRSVRDSAALLDVTSGPELGDPYAAPHKQRPFLEEVGHEVSVPLRDTEGHCPVLPVLQKLLQSVLGSGLGGNGSLVGASANLIVAGFAERSGQPIRFLPFMLMAFPLMLASVCVSAIYVYFRYF